MAYWLFKTEPDEYSIDDLAAAGSAGAPWDGIRNYQARNLLRDQVSSGDSVLIYHSSCRRVGIVGVARVIREAYVDSDQFDPSSPYFDDKSTPEKPRWFRVDLVFESRFPRVLSLSEIKQTMGLEDMVLLRQPRLSVQPVTEQEWHIIQRSVEA